MELILSRHARKLLTGHHLRDLGRFSAHLDFPLHPWLVRECDRAAHIEDFPASLHLLHTEFNWPLPRVLGKGSSTNEDTERPRFDHTPKSAFMLANDSEFVPVSSDREEPGQSIADEATTDVSSVKPKRSQRPPNLNLSPAHLDQQQHNVTLESSRADLEPSLDKNPTLFSTPTRHSCSTEKVSLMLKNDLCKCAILNAVQ